MRIWVAFRRNACVWRNDSRSGVWQRFHPKADRAQGCTASQQHSISHAAVCAGTASAAVAAAQQLPLLAHGSPPLAQGSGVCESGCRTPSLHTWLSARMYVPTAGTEMFTMPCFVMVHYQEWHNRFTNAGVGLPVLHHSGGQHGQDDHDGCQGKLSSLPHMSP